MARGARIRLPDNIIYSIIDGMDVDTFCTDPDFIGQMKEMFPEFVEEYREEYPQQWKSAIGSRLSQYADETGHIEKHGRKGNSQVWRVRGFQPGAEEVTQTATSGRAPVRDGHYESVNWMDTGGFLAIKMMYDKAFGPCRCFFRATDKGVAVISLDPDCIKFIGIRRSREDDSCYLAVGEAAQRPECYEGLRRDFDLFKASVHGAHTEEQAVIALLRQALKDGLIIREISEDHCLLNHEWRFDTAGSAQKSDVLAVNLTTARLAIVEFKSSEGKEDEANRQLREYADSFLKHHDEYCPFFTRQLNVMGNIYRNARAARGLVSPQEPELYYGYPSRGGIVISRIEA